MSTPGQRMTEGSTHPADQVIYQSRTPRVSACADDAGMVDRATYATYRVTGEVFHSWDCTATTNDDDDE